MKKKSIIFTIILLSLTIGFAAVNVILDIKSDVEIASSFNELNIFFANVVMDGESQPDSISNNGHTFKITNNLDSDNKNHIINFNVINNSFEYDANVTIECKPTSSDYTLTLDKETDIIEAQEIKPNNLSIKLVGDSSTQEITCNLKIGGLGRTTRATEQNLCLVSEDTEWTYDYTGSGEKFVPPCNGKYQIELWGAEAGTIDTSYPGGKGAYTKGTISLTEEDEFYIYVGGKGVGTVTSSNYLTSGGYNGGGYGSYGYGCSGGGGATDFRIEKNNLYTRILVSAGGGGDCKYRTVDISGGYAKAGIGGNAGGLHGYDGVVSLYSGNTYVGYGATQVSGGVGYNSSHYGSFGQGANSPAPNDDRAGGGGGYYGGGASWFQVGAGGGSSFISGHQGCVAIENTDDDTITQRLASDGVTKCTEALAKTDIKCSEHYSGYVFTNTKMIDGLGYSWGSSRGALEKMPIPAGGYYSSGVGHNGNGYARITLLKATYQGFKVTFDFDNGQTYTGYKVYGKNAQYGELPTPEKDKFIFIGWYNEEDELVTETSDVPEKNHTLKAKWKKDCDAEPGTVWDFEFIDGEDEFKIPCKGVYQLEVWGAQGGSTSNNLVGGYGAYSIGDVQFDKNEILYINVGEQGDTSEIKKQPTDASYNGGGAVSNEVMTDSDSVEYRGAGGGATHIATVSGQLFELKDYIGSYDSTKKVYYSDNILIVAAGGGGALHYSGPKWSEYASCHGGNGGGIEGTIGICEINQNLTRYISSVNVPTQSSVGKITFSSGTVNISDFGIGSTTRPGSGGGFFGGYSWIYISQGGSSYIASPRLTSKAMYCYNCNTSNDPDTLTITKDVTYNETATANTAKVGNGHARITLISID